MPLSFSAILGGKLSYIGTASNIVLMGLYLEHLAKTGEQAPSSTVQFWGIATVGVPCAIAGLALIVIASRWLLPERCSS